VDSMGSAQVIVRTPEPDKLLAALPSPAFTRDDDGTLALTGVEPAEVGEAALRAGVVLHELTTRRADLERVFLELTQGKAAIR